MKYSLFALALASSLSLPASADFLGGLNKAVNKVNSANTQAQEAAAKAQAVQQASPSELLQQALASQLKEGVTTQDQLLALLGTPESVTTATDGVQTLKYKASGVAEKVLSAQSIASAFGVQTPDLTGWLSLVVEDGVLSGYQVDAQ